MKVKRKAGPQTVVKVGDFEFRLGAANLELFEQMESWILTYVEIEGQVGRRNAEQFLQKMRASNFLVERWAKTKPGQPRHKEYTLDLPSIPQYLTPKSRRPKPADQTSPPIEA